MATEEQTDQTCSPCRGTGRLISGLGGDPHEVTCPWCRGTGRRIAGLDAQQEPAEGGPPREAPATSANPPATPVDPSATASADARVEETDTD